MRNAIWFHVSLWVIALCAGPALGAQQPADASFLVTPEWLNTHKGDSGVRVLDVRPEDDYSVGHIDGAVNLPIDRLFVNDNDKRFIAPLAQVQAELGKAGIDNGTLVVVYDGGEFLSSARAFWVLEVYGHERVVALDGGLAGWEQRSLPTTTKEFRPEARVFVPTVTPNRLATKFTTRLAIDKPNATIIDARDAPAYRGEKSVAQRFGHIRSAINIPVMDHFDQVDGVKRLKSTAQLAREYQSIDPAKKVVTYCNTGVLSATTYFVLRRLGYDVANYDGSWTEWGNDPALPINTPNSAAAPARPASSP